MEDKKKKYEAPKVMRLDDRELGRGDCIVPGNSDFMYCEGNGSNAVGSCLSFGDFAAGDCVVGIGDIIGN